MSDKTKYIPILVILTFYILVLMQGVYVARVQNDFSFIILGLTAPLPLMIAIVVSILKLSKKEKI